MIDISATKCIFFSINICSAVSIYAVWEEVAHIAQPKGESVHMIASEDSQPQKELLPAPSISSKQQATEPMTAEEKYSSEMKSPEYKKPAKPQPSPDDPLWKIPKAPYRVLKPSPPNTISVAAILRHVQQVLRDYFHAYRPRWLSSLFPRWFPIPIR